MKSIIFILACLFFSSPVLANTCVYKGKAKIAESKTIDIEECWELTGWSAEDSKSFCQQPTEEDSEVVGKFCPKCKCKIGSSGSCTFKMPSAAVANKLSEEYFKQNNIPPELRKQIEANMAKLNKETQSPFSGKPIKLYYYPGKGLDLKTHQDDCKNRSGKFNQG